MSKNFVVCAVEKVHDWQSLSKRAGHNERATPPDHAWKPRPDQLDANAPKWRSDKPAYLVGGPGFAAEWKTEHAQCHQRKLKDGQSPVLARELVLSASPEFFEGKGRNAVNEWAETVRDWAIERWGAERVGQMVLHLDEQTPHAHIWLKPIKASKKHGWEISDRSLGFDGREKMMELHDSIAAATAHLGLSRGVRGSAATHEETAAWRGRMREAEKGLPKVNWKPVLTPPTLADRMNPAAYGKRAAKAALAQVAPHHVAALAQASDARKARREKWRVLNQLDQLSKAGDKAKEALALCVAALGRMLGLGRPLDLNSLADLAVLKAQMPTPLAPEIQTPAPPAEEKPNHDARRKASAGVPSSPRRMP